MKKTPAIVVVGPTASGKTALAVGLAEIFDGEIISADSMQIYRGMDIATAAPTPEERRGIRHHLIGFLDPAVRYSVADFRQDAMRAVREIDARGKTVIVAGGTGLYVDALIGNLDFEDEPDNAVVRQTLAVRRNEEGIGALYEELRAADPALAAEIDPRNEKRVLRALEIYLLTGERPSDRRRRAAEKESEFEPVYIGLRYRDRAALYDRIALRVDRMLEAGLLEEARVRLAAPDAETAAQAIGYKELAPFLRGEKDLAAAREDLIRATRRYAKRQLTWFGRNDAIRWIERDGKTEDEILAEAVTIVRESGILKGREQP